MKLRSLQSLNVRCYQSNYSQCRRYAVQAPGAPTLQVFNRHTKWQQRERAARNVEESRQVDYLRDEVASRLCERLLVSGILPFLRAGGEGIML